MSPRGAVVAPADSGAARTSLGDLAPVANP